MFSEMDTDAFLAYAKAHRRDLVQQAEMDALRRCAVLQKQGKARSIRRHLTLLRSTRYCQRAVCVRCHTLWRRWIFVARAWASGHPSQAPRTSRG